MLTRQLEESLNAFCAGYLRVAKDPDLSQLQVWRELVTEQAECPHPFAIYHRALRSPIDYYQLGLDLMRPLVDMPASQIVGVNILQEVTFCLRRGENVIFLANHQTEPDPQLIGLLLHKAGFPQLSEQLICVAGHRVVQDPMAIPLSLGCNLLCIYSKKYVEQPPEQKREKIAHNQRTLQQLKALLCEGGHAIFIAPSGGRDRIDGQGKMHVAHFSPESIELLALLAKQSPNRTHFYPLAINTHTIMPAPSAIRHPIGEEREIAFGPIGMGVLPKLFSISSRDEEEKLPLEQRERRRLERAHTAWEQVSMAFTKLHS